MEDEELVALLSDRDTDPPLVLLSSANTTPRGLVNIST